MFGIFKKKKNDNALKQPITHEETSSEIELDDFLGAVQPEIISELSLSDDADITPAPIGQDEAPSKTGLLSRLKEGLSKSSTQISEGLGGIFTKRKLDYAMLDALEELLILSDMGAVNAATIVKNFSKGRFNKDIDEAEVRLALAVEVEKLLRDAEQPLRVNSAYAPHVIMVVGVNGNGKTTTIGKMAAKFHAEGKHVVLAAADTFRAAAVEQLQVWAERANVEIITGAHEADPASVAYAAYERAKSVNADVLLIDTAGRLHNKQNLMQELAKIVRVLQKIDANAPHNIVMVLDGTTGQNALQQVRTFKEFVPVSGCIVTKLDGTAKGGMVVALAQQEQVDIHFVGVGEQIDDLQPFIAADFARSLTGVV
jgi:fused signal recognition particle receptor